MVINFRAREINQATCKLNLTPMLILKKIKIIPMLTIHYYNVIDNS